MNLRESAYQQIREMLLRGELVAGEPVSTLQLAKKLGISRTPVREAIAQLICEGHLNQKSHLRPRVSDSSRRELEEVYALRQVLEEFSAAEAARHINQDELEQLQQCCDRWEVLIRAARRSTQGCLTLDQWHEWIALDEHFHRVLYAASGNSLLVKTLSDLRLMSRAMSLLKHEQLQVVSSLQRLRLTHRNHQLLIKALHARDAKSAVKLMREQIIRGKNRHLADCGAE